jgi:hypothetical protein
MDTARASIEIQCVIAVGFIFAVLVVIAVINLWYGTSGDDRTNPPKTR